MVPAAFVRLDALPLTPNGKLDRKALPEPGGSAHAAAAYAPPQGEIEESLAEIWAGLLKVGKVGRHDNFFELGGHSLLAVQTVSALKRTGIAVSVADVFAYPSVQSLAGHAVRQGRGLAVSGVTAFRPSGSEPALFLVHEVSGDVGYGAAITPHIDADIPVYGLSGDASADAPLQTVQALAARLLPKIRAVRPTGPYRIAGWSFGGILAYEITTQLIGEDETVEFLGLLDTYHKSEIAGAEARHEVQLDDTAFLADVVRRAQGLPETHEISAAASTMDFPTLVRTCQEHAWLPTGLSVDTRVPDRQGCVVKEYGRTAVLMRLVGIYEQSAQRPLEIGPGDLDALEDEAQLALLHERLVRVGLLPKQSKPEALRGTLRAFGTAMRTPYYSGPVRLVLAHRPRAGLPDNEEAAAQWRRWAPDLDHWQSPGNHMAVLKRPYADSLAAWLELG